MPPEAFWVDGLLAPDENDGAPAYTAQVLLDHLEDVVSHLRQQLAKPIEDRAVLWAVPQIDQNVPDQILVTLVVHRLETLEEYDSRLLTMGEEQTPPPRPLTEYERHQQKITEALRVLAELRAKTPGAP
jgi:hypothetical protein